MAQSNGEDSLIEAASGNPRKFIYLLAGVFAYCFIRFVMPLPEGMSPQALEVAAVLVLMMIWWLTEALPLAITALVPLVIFPFTGVMDMDAAASSYGDPVIFLYLGGFILAIAMERWGLHRRIALNIVRVVGSNANMIIAGFMLATAFLSMWISNTATVVMMIPISLSVVHLLMRESDVGEGARNFAVCMMLGLAYAASIGGVGTIIGTPPNAVLVGYLRNAYGIEIGFFQWMLLGVPAAAIMLVICWRVLLRLYPNHMGHIEGAEQVIGAELEKLGGWSREEKLVAMIFGGTALLWVLRPVISAALPGIALNDSGIAVMGALMLFIIPASFKHGQMLLTWREAEGLPWGVLLLFGGGLCLATAVKASLLAEWIGTRIQSVVDVSEFTLILIIAGVIVMLTEFMSNVATITTFLPIIAALAVAFGYAPIDLMIPATLAASFAFMTPVATPPNAVVFSSGHIRIKQMAYAGLWLNMLALLVVPALCYVMMGYIFD